jgi:acyl dehydratase
MPENPGGKKGNLGMKTLYFEDVQIGDEIPRLSKEAVDEVQFVKYAGASGDFNPLHYVDATGKKAGQGGVIAQGMLIMGFTGQAITDWLPNRSIKMFKVRFVNVTRPGDVITVSGKVVEKKEKERTIVCEIAALDQNGQAKLTGLFEAALP